MVFRGAEDADFDRRDSDFSDVSSIVPDPERTPHNACRWPGRAAMAEKLRQKEEADRIKREEIRKFVAAQQAAVQACLDYDDLKDESDDGSGLSDDSDKPESATKLVVKENWPQAAADEETGSGFSESSEEPPEEAPLSPMSRGYTGPRVKFSVQLAEDAKLECFVVLVRFDWAPLAAQHFMDLVEADYFRDTRFHRVVKGFVAQFGFPPDPAMYETWGSRLVEAEKAKRSNLRGKMHFVMKAPGMPSNQIGINLADNSSLDADGCSPFAEVVSGISVLDRLFAEYGDQPPIGSGPDPECIAKQGLSYLKGWPKLSHIVRTERVRTPRSSLKGSRILRAGDVKDATSDGEEKHISFA